MLIALLAAGSMVIQDSLATVMVLAEARGRGWLAGWMDTIGWLFSISVISLTVTSLQGHNLTQKILVIALVSAANLFGTRLGEFIGTKWVTDGTSVADRLMVLEEAAGIPSPLNRPRSGPGARSVRNDSFKKTLRGTPHSSGRS